MAKSTPNYDVRKIGVAAELPVAEFNRLLDPGTTWDKEEGAKFLSDPDAALFVAFVDGAAVGFLTAYRLQRFDRRKAGVLLYEVGVAEAFQRQGIGKALIQAVKEWAHAGGADEVWVLTEGAITAAIALYRSTGGERSAPGTEMFTFPLNSED